MPTVAQKNLCLLWTRRTYAYCAAADLGILRGGGGVRIQLGMLCFNWCRTMRTKPTLRKSDVTLSVFRTPYRQV